MVVLRIVCALLLVAIGHAEVPHAVVASQDNAAADTIYRETVATPKGHTLGRDVSYSTHSGPVVSHAGPVSHGGPVLSHPAPVSHGGPVVSHAGPVSHGGPVVSHAGPVSHGGPVVSHGGLVSHGGPVLSHAAPVNHGGPVVSHAGQVSHGGPVLSHPAPVSHGGPVVGHGGSVVSHAGPVSHGGPVVSHAGPVSHGGSIVSHAGSVSHGGSVLSHAGSVSHGGPILGHAGHVGSKPQVVHNAPVAHAAVLQTPVISYGSGYQKPVRSQYHAQDVHGQYSFGYNAGTSARDETRDAYGNVRGSFTYIDSYGNLQTQHYVAGKGGFQVEGTNLPVQVSHDRRHKRSYATFPSSTSPLGNGIPTGDFTTVTRHEQGPIVEGRPGPYGGSHGVVVYQPPLVVNKGLAHANGYEVSPLLGNSNLHGNFEKYGYNGFSYGFETGPSSLTTYGTHFDQHIPSYTH